MIWEHAFPRSRNPSALWLLALAFAVRALVPQGYMVAPGAIFALIPCPQASAALIPAPAHHAAMDHSAHAPAQDDGAMHHGDADKAGDGVCAFAPLGQAAAAGADPVLLAAAIALVFAALLARPVPLPPLRRRAWLHPPLRGPPATA